MPPPLAPHGMCLKIMNERNTKAGKGSVEDPLKFMDQDYDSLLDMCLKERKRFVDYCFPPEPRSIGKEWLTPAEMSRVVWKRPMVLCNNPKLVVGGVSRFDYAQGNLGNCWFLASVGSLTFQNKLLPRVIPAGQSFSYNYAGIFHFRFWRFGKWFDVVIDDKLPTLDDRLIFVQSKTYNEFWPALLEKAYAKVCGSYVDMHAGCVSEALMDFTGGIHMHYELKTAPDDLWDIMQRANQAKALMGCESPPSGVMSDGNPVKLVRLFNPWGYKEWNGDWSDNSLKWDTVSEEERKKNRAAENGEFWMSMKDFTRAFENLDICCLSSDFLNDDTPCDWTSKYHYGSWVIGSTAGGSMKYKETFCTNPQFWLKINEIDKQHDKGNNNVMVCLIQIPDKRNRHQAALHAIGFDVFEVPLEMRSEGKFGASFFNNRHPVATSGDYKSMRDVMKFFRLEPGEYLIVPSTFEHKKKAEFILSFCCKNEIHIQKDSERTKKTFLVDLPKADYTESGDQGLYYSKPPVFRQYSDQYKDVDAESLQQLLHQNLFEGEVKLSQGFGLDTCRSMIAMSDSRVTGRLDGSEFLRLWNKILTYKEIFYSMDSSKDGFLSLDELQNTFKKTGMNLTEEILNLMVVRYGGEKISLEGFICLVLRLNCMASIFQKFCKEGTITLDESEWIRITMYS
ncbi:calpain-1 catalytic subunit isoform X2 [Xyrauchen texanus]|uniref:calpain-1 catalytic subunit isoform X2 n=1 Tax=Xyrauchen texanus TaxID=154827 RepID=UPI00224200E5|nr:calpain-1 catalytic subunit isoform X2 [Xyrauchen texanus]